MQVQEGHARYSLTVRKWLWDPSLRLKSKKSEKFQIRADENNQIIKNNNRNKTPTDLKSI